MAYKLHVDRAHLVRDTLTQLVTSDQLTNFKKPLQVHISSWKYI